MKPTLISMASETEGVSEYLKSLKNLEDSVRWMSFEYIGDFGEIKEELPTETKRIKMGKAYPGHVARFEDLLRYFAMDFAGGFLEEDGWWIFTDTADVRFQAPFDFTRAEATGHDIIIAEEGALHKENSFWVDVIEKTPLFKVLLEYPIRNMGLVAMKKRIFLDYLHWYSLFLGAFDKNTPFIDQLIFNFYLIQRHRSPYIASDNRMFGTLYAGVEKGSIVKKGDKFYTEDGHLITAIHANGSTKELL